jgi:hypothetical protein
MCLYLFAPKRELQIEFAAEAVNLIDGGSEAVFDILLKNHSKAPLNRIHVVYPHPIPLDGSRTSPYFQDITETWLQKNSPYNRFYQTKETHLTRSPQKGFDLVTVDSPDPTNILEQLSYAGVISGPHHLRTFEVAEGERLTTDQWKILSELGWSVWTVKFDTAIDTNSARWLRFRAWSGINRQNKMPSLERFLKRHGGVLVDVFEITGPIDMRYRIVSALKVAGRIEGSTAAHKYSQLELHRLQQNLLYAIEAEGTETNVNDWRVNVFAPNYRHIDDLQTNGDIVACGPGKNELRDNTGKIITCYQWKAGSRNIKPQNHHGQFQISMHALDIPNFTIALPWFSLAVGVLGLIASSFALLLWLLAK